MKKIPFIIKLFVLLAILFVSIPILLVNFADTTYIIYVSFIFLSLSIVFTFLGYIYIYIYICYFFVKNKE